MDNPDFRTSDDIVWILCASQQNDKGRWVTIICRVKQKEYNVALYNISEKILTTLEKHLSPSKGCRNAMIFRRLSRRILILSRRAALSYPKNSLIGRIVGGGLIY